MSAVSLGVMPDVQVGHLKLSTSSETASSGFRASSTKSDTCAVSARNLPLQSISIDPKLGVERAAAGSQDPGRTS